MKSVCVLQGTFVVRLGPGDERRVEVAEDLWLRVTCQ
jgi:hypothetical protein